MLGSFAPKNTISFLVSKWFDEKIPDKKLSLNIWHFFPNEGANFPNENSSPKKYYEKQRNYKKI